MDRSVRPRVGGCRALCDRIMNRTALDHGSPVLEVIGNTNTGFSVGLSEHQIRLAKIQTAGVWTVTRFPSRELRNRKNFPGTRPSSADWPMMTNRLNFFPDGHDC